MPIRRSQSLADPSAAERDLLGAFRYSRNLAVLHTDESFMPKRRSVWSSWNYIGSRDGARNGVCVTYWMNCLQNIESEVPLFVTLNPPRPPRAGSLLHSELYEHPMFDAKAMAAQRKLWSLQGERNTWFCGAYFGVGLPRGRLAGGACGRRATRRRAAAVARAERIRAHCADGARPARPALRSCWYDVPIGALCRIGDASAFAPAHPSFPLSRLLAPARSRRAGPSFPASCGGSLTTGSISSASTTRDHGDGSATPLRAQVERQAPRGADRACRRLDPAALHAAHARLLLQSAEHLFLLPRGWHAGALVYQVHNTFGERHSYVIPVEDGERRGASALPEGALRLALPRHEHAL